MKFPRPFLDNLNDKADIVEIISDYVVLKPAGRNYVGLCPFHREKTPSFSVDAGKQLYYCFGCHAGGNVINFVMAAEKLDFPEAVGFLAGKLNLPLPEETAPQGVSQKTKERLLAANRAAAQWYHALLYTPEGKQGVTYLYNRGLDDATIRRFGLGYAPEGWAEASSALEKQGFTREELLLAGLSKRADTGIRDVFRSRVMFPIVQPGGGVVAFSGRVLDNSKPKYLNTSDTPVFNKHRVLYGLNLQKKSQSRRALLVEGQMDVVALSQNGVDFAVASLGTAFSRDHVRLLKRTAEEIFLCYDGDSAGQAAAKKAIDAFAADRVPVRVLNLPGGADPDEFIRKQGADAFMNLLSNARASLAFLLDTEAEKADLTTEEGRAAYASAASSLIGKYARDTIDAELYYKRVHRETGFSLDALTRASMSKAPAYIPPGNTPENAPKPEEEALALLLFHPALRVIPQAAELLEYITLPFAKELYRYALPLPHALTKEELFMQFGDEPEQGAFLGALLLRGEPANPAAYFQDALCSLRLNKLEQQRASLTQELSQLNTASPALRELLLALEKINKDIMREKGRKTATP